MLYTKLVCPFQTLCNLSDTVVCNILFFLAFETSHLIALRDAVHDGGDKDIKIQGGKQIKRQKSYRLYLISSFLAPLFQLETP